MPSIGEQNLVRFLSLIDVDSKESPITSKMYPLKTKKFHEIHHSSKLKNKYNGVAIGGFSFEAPNPCGQAIQIRLPNHQDQHTKNVIAINAIVPYNHRRLIAGYHKEMIK